MKLWEVLKELEENPDKKFKSVNYNQEEIIISMGAGCYDLPFRVLDSNRDWQEVKQPVPWQEAIEAWAKGSSIKCECEGGVTFFSPPHKSSACFTAKLITRGTWYIKED